MLTGQCQVQEKRNGKRSWILQIWWRSQCPHETVHKVGIKAHELWEKELSQFKSHMCEATDNGHNVWHPRLPLKKGSFQMEAHPPAERKCFLLIQCRHELCLSNGSFHLTKFHERWLTPSSIELVFRKSLADTVDHCVAAADDFARETTVVLPVSPRTHEEEDKSVDLLAFQIDGSNEDHLPGPA